MFKMAKEMVLIKWINNNSIDYDGKEHYVPKEKLVQKNAKEGDMVSVKWVRKTWNGILLSIAKFKKGKKITDEKNEVNKTECRKQQKQTLTEKDKRGKIEKQKDGKKTGEVSDISYLSWLF